MRINLNNKPFAIGAATGAFVIMVMPDEWSNLAYTPWWIEWLIGPSFMVYASICMATLTDFVSHNGANPHWLKTLWVLSGASVMGIYALGFSIMARLARRFGAT